MSERGTLSSRSRARAHARGIYLAETVAITSFPWELFGNRWGKFPRTGQPAQPRFVVPTPPNALSLSLFLALSPPLGHPRYFPHYAPLRMEQFLFSTLPPPFSIHVISLFLQIVFVAFENFEGVWSFYARFYSSKRSNFIDPLSHEN